MNRRSLGRSGLPVSELCLGTLNFGWRVGEALALDLLDAFRAAGGNFIQASSAGLATERPVLAVQEASEAWVGRWWRERRIPRSELFLATRFVLPGSSAPGRADRESLIRRHCEQSLQRLRTEYLDLVLVEWNDALTPLDDALQGLTRLRRAGMVRYFGAAGFPAWRLMESLHRSAQRDFDRFEVAQFNYSVLTAGEREREVLQLCHEYRLGCIARSPLAGGALTRPPEPGSVASSLLDELTRMAARYRVSPAQLALAWVLAQPNLTAPVLGTSNLAHLQQLLAVPRLTIQPADLAALTTALTTASAHPLNSPAHAPAL